MQIAFASDVHGNLPAFEAVVAELDRRGPFDGTYGGGDFLIGGLYPRGCVQRLMDLGWPCVRGNAEEMVVDVATKGAQPVHACPPEVANSQAFRDLARWSAERLDEPQLNFLKDLPLTLTYTGPSAQTLMLAHATPWSAHPIVWQDAETEAKRELLERAGTDALIYAHIHYPYQEEIDGRTLCCMGSAGMAFDGDPRACFTIAADNGDGWRFEHVRVEYDSEAYARELEHSDMPDGAGAASMIRSATR